MAARLNKKHQQSVRDRIQTTQLVKRLTNHGLGKLKKPMDATQVRAAEVVLRKSLPDLQSIELGGSIETKHHVTHEELVGLLLRGSVPAAARK